LPPVDALALEQPEEAFGGLSIAGPNRKLQQRGRITTYNREL
jgi:hypothetical protein